MNIHEYQAKELLQKFDVATTRGRVATTLDEAEQIARELGDIDIVVKAQITPAGAARAVSRTDLRAACTFAKRLTKSVMLRRKCSAKFW